MGFPRQEHWSGAPFLLPGDLPDPGIEFMSPALAGRFSTTEPPGSPRASWGALLPTTQGLSTHPACPWPPGLALSPQAPGSEDSGTQARLSRMAHPGLWVWRNYCWPEEVHPPLLGPLVCAQLLRGRHAHLLTRRAAARHRLHH